jgi:multidrug resistance efflux pump
MERDQKKIFELSVGFHEALRQLAEAREQLAEAREQLENVEEQLAEAEEQLRGRSPGSH